MNLQRNRVGKYFSDTFPVKEMFETSIFFIVIVFYCVLEYAIKRVQVNQEGW
jgi:hypothetical protein